MVKDGGSLATDTAHPRERTRKGARGVPLPWRRMGSVHGVRGEDTGVSVARGSVLPTQGSNKTFRRKGDFRGP